MENSKVKEFIQNLGAAELTEEEIAIVKEHHEFHGDKQIEIIGALPQRAVFVKVIDHIGYSDSVIDCIDFKNAEVNIDKSLNRKQSIKGFRQSKSKFDDVPSSMGWHSYCDRIYEITTPKNKASYRRVMMPKNLVDIISQYKIKCESEYEFNDDFFVFGGKLPLVDQTIRRRLDSYAKKAGVKQIRIHDLRHSHASLLINKGQNILIVSKRLGHSDITQTLNTYSHLFPNVQKQIIDAIDIKL